MRGPNRDAAQKSKCSVLAKVWRFRPLREVPRCETPNRHMREEPTYNPNILGLSTKSLPDLVLFGARPSHTVGAEVTIRKH